MKHTNWRNLTDNPVDSKVYPIIKKMILDITQPLSGGFSAVLERFRGKSVLDIGVAEHDLTHYKNQEHWKHGKICAVAKECLGIDILESMVKLINADGYNCLCVDATSDIDLGSKYDCVYIGDVIEHVSDPVKLLNFAARHLSDNGEIIVATPNPYFYKHILRLVREKTFIANYEHVSWVGETMAYELGCRANLRLNTILRPVSAHGLKSKIQAINLGFFSPSFYYVFIK